MPSTPRIATHAGSRAVPGGESETIIGNWIKRSGKRDKVLIATKVGEDMGEGRSLKKDYILRECETSLRRLQTDHIDLYQTHFDDEVTPVEETMQAYATLIKAGKVRAIGASNISPARLTASLAASKDLGLPRYESLQPLYNLSDRKEFETEFAPICREHKLGVINYYSLAAGFLTGKYRSAEEGAKHPGRGGRLKRYLDARGLGILKVLAEVAARHNALQAQIALAWLIARPIVTAPIVSATSLKQLGEIMKAPEIKLSPGDIAALDAAGSLSSNAEPHLPVRTLMGRMNARASIAGRKRPSAHPARSRRRGISNNEVRDVEELATPRTPVIYEVVRRLGEEEMARPLTSLWWSGVAAGLSISFSLLAQAILQAHLPDAPWRPLVTSFGYCIGFVMAVLSRQQLFTESTITAVLPLAKNFTFDNLGRTARLWAIVLAANLAGTLFAALFCAYSPVLTPELYGGMLTISQSLLDFSWCRHAVSRNRRRLPDGGHGLAYAGRRAVAVSGDCSHDLAHRRRRLHPRGRGQHGSLFAGVFRQLGVVANAGAVHGASADWQYDWRHGAVCADFLRPGYGRDLSRYLKQNLNLKHHFRSVSDLKYWVKKTY